MAAFWLKCDLDVGIFVGGELMDALATGRGAMAMQVSHVYTSRSASCDFNLIPATFDHMITLTGTPSLSISPFALPRLF
jgi:hypothetical protein